MYLLTFYVMHITHPKTNNNNSTAGHEKCFYFRIFIHVPPKHIVGKLSAPRDIHMTSHFGYLVLLITRTFLSSPVRFEITSVDCIMMYCQIMIIMSDTGCEIHKN